MPKFGRSQRRGVPKGAARQGKQGMALSIPRPPPIRPQITHHQRMRFISNAAVFRNITFQNLLDTIGVAITAVLGFDVFDQVKVNFIEVWSLPAIGSSSTVTIQFSGAGVGSLGDGSVHSDSSMGIEPAHVFARPNFMSQSGQWQVSNTNAAFTLTCPTGSVVDVDLSFRVLTTQPPMALQNALVAATVGDIFYRGLDGLASAATALPAQAPTVN